MRKGVEITLADVDEANVHLLNVLYGLVKNLLEPVIDKSPAASRTFIEVVGAVKSMHVGLPLFIDLDLRLFIDLDRPEGEPAPSTP